MWGSFLHLLTRSLDQSVSYFSTSKLAVVVSIAAFVLPNVRVWISRGFRTMTKHVGRDLGLGGLLVLVVWLGLFGWSAVKIIYADHRAFVEASSALRKQVDDLNAKLGDLKSAPPKTVTRFLPTPPSGPSKPDRVLTDQQKDHLYQGLKKLAADPLYANVASITIAPYAEQDRESLRLAEQLAGVFADAHWKVLRANQLPTKLVGRAQNQIPIGIWILTNRDSNFRYYLWSNLHEAGLESDERPVSDLPPDFDGLIIWVGYKDTPF